MFTDSFPYIGIWNVLVNYCGANADWQGFDQSFPACREFRFGGSLGFGGKVWCDHGRVYVTCYPEDETPERLDIISTANVLLERIMDAMTKTCLTCEGSGKVKNEDAGNCDPTYVVCPTCKGAGRIVNKQ